MPRTLFDKIWDSHLVGRRADGRELLYIDRHVLHELHAPHAFETLEQQHRPVRRPDLTFSMQDHTVATKPGRDDNTNPPGAAFLKAMREGSARNRIKVFDLGDPEQGISHVVAPELGMVLPGATHAVPDSHASTVGGVGALAFGCGTTEMTHILATQVMAMKRPKSMRIRLDGRLGAHVSAKDVALRIIAEIGVSGARGHVVEYAGAAARAMPIEQRMTMCNLNIEMGGRSGFVAPDDSTIQWLAGRPYAPQGAMWDRAVATWRTLTSDDGAVFDKEIALDCGTLEPQITWGTDPSQVLGISGRVPDPATAEANRRAAMESALAYMGLEPGMTLAGLPVHRVFIGSCTNSRLPDLQAAADVVRGRRVAQGVVAMVVPGSTTVKRQAEAAGLDRVFRDAGFFWGESGCSMCAGGNGDRGEPGERCVSTTNRNFENRQGSKVRTHLVSPVTAAATAIAGRIADVRQLRERMMQPFSTHTGIAVPLLRDDVNTDQVSPVQAMREMKPDYRKLLFMRGRDAEESGFPAQPAAVSQPRHPGHRPQLRRRLLARGRGLGDARQQHPRHRGEELRRHLSRELPAERPAAGGAAAGRGRCLHRARGGGERRGAVHGRSEQRSASAGRAGRTSPSTFRLPTGRGCWRGSTTSG